MCIPFFILRRIFAMTAPEVKQPAVSTKVTKISNKIIAKNLKVDERLTNLTSVVEGLAKQAKNSPPAKLTSLTKRFIAMGISITTIIVALGWAGGVIDGKDALVIISSAFTGGFRHRQNPVFVVFEQLACGYDAG